MNSISRAVLICLFGLSLLSCQSSDNGTPIHDGGGGQDRGSGGPQVDPNCVVSGDSLGPGIINGTTLSPQARLARGIVYLISSGDVEGQGFACTGILISKRLVLTAAHCVRNDAWLTPEEKAQKTTLIFSVDPLCDVLGHQRYERRLRPVRILPHESYNRLGTSENDVALIFLGENAPAYTQPLALSLDEENLPDDEKVYLAGYGRTSDLTQPLNEFDLHLRFTQVFPATDRGVVFQGRKLENDPKGDLLILDTSRGTAACSGDSGGPAVIMKNGRLTVAGIASFVYDPQNVRSTCELRAAYTRPSYFKDWILEHAGREL